MQRKKRQEQKGDDADKWYFAAAGRWPSVQWSRGNYGEHFEIVIHPETRCHEDLFLGGAAGFNATHAWSAIYEEFSSDVIRCLRRMHVPGYEPHDLWALAITRLLRPVVGFPSDGFDCNSGFQIPPAKIVEFQGRSSLRNYLLLVAQNIGKDKIRKRDVENDGSRIDLESANPAIAQRASHLPAAGSVLTQEEIDRVQKVLVEAMGTLSKNERRMLQAITVLGLSNKEASKMFGYSESSSSRYRQSAIETLQRAIRAGFEAWGEVDERVVEVATRFIQRILQCLIDDPSS